MKILAQGISGPVLITGHTGFKGTWLTYLLQELGVDVVGYSLPALSDSLYSTASRLGCIQEDFGDIRNYERIESFISTTKPSHIIHLAAQPLVLDSYKEPIKTFSTNVLGTANLLEACRKKSFIKSISVATTDKVYRNNDAETKFKETDPLEGQDPYSASKVATEAVVAAWRNILKDESDAKIVALRAGNVIGGGDFSRNRLVPDCVRAHMNKTHVVIRRPLSTRPWQHVLDPLLGYLLAGQLAQADSYNFGPTDDLSLTVQEVVSELQKTIKFEYQIQNDDNAPYEANFLSLDSTLARRDLGWRCQFDQLGAINLTGDWWLRKFKGEPAQDITESQVKEFASNLVLADTVRQKSPTLD
jgi:CDP-glucose 4,6-dehydratase